MSRVLLFVSVLLLVAGCGGEGANPDDASSLPDLPTVDSGDGEVVWVPLL